MPLYVNSQKKSQTSFINLVGISVDCAVYWNEFCITCTLRGREGVKAKAYIYCFYDVILMFKSVQGERECLKITVLYGRSLKDHQKCLCCSKRCGYYLHPYWAPYSQKTKFKNLNI